jgi:membrane-bound ClpP family serine protease
VFCYNRLRVSGRFIVAIISTLLEETAIAVIVLVGLPRLGIKIPIAGLVALMFVWMAIAIVTYRAGSRALKRKPVTGIEALVGSQGEVVGLLDPEGTVKIGGELWRARSAGDNIGVGEEVTVVSYEGQRLIVTRKREMI